MTSHFALDLARRSTEISRAQMSARRRLDAAEAREEQRKNAARASALALVQRGMAADMTMVERRLDADQDAQDAAASETNGGGDSGRATPPLLNMTVDIGTGGRTAMLKVREGDSPRSLARAFCEKHSLGSHSWAELTKLIETNLIDAMAEDRPAADSMVVAEGTQQQGPIATPRLGAMQEAAMQESWDAAAVAAEAAAARRKAKKKGMAAAPSTRRTGA